MSYDRFAPYYMSVESLVFGRDLQKARCAGLDGASPEDVLIIGDGNGRFLEEALHAWPMAEFVSIDASEGMLKIARNRVHDPRVRFIHADVLDGLHTLDGRKFDTIVTHFFLDCFCEETLGIILPVLLANLSLPGRWYISDFTGRSFRHRVMLWLMYRFFHTFTETPATRLHDYRPILKRLGLSREILGTWRNGFIAAEKWQRAGDPVSPPANPHRPGRV